MEKQIGKEGKFKLEVVAGQLVITFGYQGAGLGADLVGKVDADYFLDELAKLIPGETVVETFTIGALKAAFHATKI